MPDATTTIAELREMIRRFVAARQWEQFHAPKNLSMALAIEAAELMEHFQWIGVDLSRDLKHDAEKRAAVGEELADVICYALALANELDLDVSETMRAKMKKNEAKYPAGEYQGKYGADDDGRR
jgi:NTP pyrophosphatase (non-canonical NTP hydrolase)